MIVWPLVGPLVPRPVGPDPAALEVIALALHTVLAVNSHSFFSTATIDPLFGIAVAVVNLMEIETNVELGPRVTTSVGLIAIPVKALVLAYRPPRVVQSKVLFSKRQVPSAAPKEHAAVAAATRASRVVIPDIT